MGRFYDYIDGNTIKNDFGIKIFVETGTSDGYQFYDYIKYNFDKYYSCEIHKEQYDIAIKNVGYIPNLHIFNQSSVDFLSNLLPTIKDIPTVFWLDAHLPGSQIGFPLSYEKDKKIRMPLEDEITLLKKLKNTDNDVILCDDLRHYEDGIEGVYDYGDWDQRKELGGDNIDFIYENFKETHDIKKHYGKGGCVILTPKHKNITIGALMYNKHLPSIGDTLCLTPIIEEISKQNKQPIKVATLFPELFLNNPYVSEVVSTTEPSIKLSISFDYHTNVVQYYANQLNIKLPKNYKPHLYLSPEEIKYAKDALKEFNGYKKIAISLKTSAECKDIDYEYILPLLTRLKQNGYKLIGLGIDENASEQHIYDKSFINLTTIREASAIIKLCNLYLGVDAGLYHIAAAVGVPQVVFFRNNGSSNNSYSNTHYIDSTIKCGDSCLVPHLRNCQSNNRCIDNFDLHKYYDLVTSVLTKKKVCYVINFYFGNRRYNVEKFKEDPLCYLRSQIETLSKYTHSLSKIVFSFNVEPEHYLLLSEALNIIPKRIQSTDVDINIRENYGMSYGAFSDVFKKYQDEYDYYIFNEDDYFFVQNNFDKYLVNKFESLVDCGYLCGLVRDRAFGEMIRHAGMSSGICSYRVLKEVMDKYGELPHSKEKEYLINERQGQTLQTIVIRELGYEIYDIREEYRMSFWGGDDARPELLGLINIHFMWQKDDLFLPAKLYYNEPYYWVDRIDGEFLRMECDYDSLKYHKYF